MANMEAYEMPFLLVKGHEVSVKDILKLMASNEASDLYLKVGERVVIIVAENMRRLDSEHLREMQLEHIRACFFTPIEIERFNERGEVDLVHTEGNARYRVHVGTAAGGEYVVIRRIVQSIRPLANIGLPDAVLRHLQKVDNGLILISGATGHGKTVTAVALLDHIARTRESTILTLEDPIEFIFENHRALFIQREVGMHVKSFAEGVRSALRENIDVIFVGEMREPETIDQVLKASEMGHLVISTIHADDTISTLGRVMGSMPAKDQARIRYTLSAGLGAVIYQKLLPSTTRGKRKLCAEVTFPTGAIRTVIRSGDLTKLGTYLGMPGSGATFQDHLKDLANAGHITTQIWEKEITELQMRSGSVRRTEENT